MKALEDIAAERCRQIEVEGWALEHDDTHTHSELALAAACYALPSTARSIPFTYGQDSVRKRLWPWDVAWWKPRDRRQDLVKAGALIVAEIERLDRAKEAQAAASIGADVGAEAKPSFQNGSDDTVI